MNNWTEDELKSILNASSKYVIAAEEKGENGTPHLQGYMEFSTQKRLTTIKTIMPRAHIETRKGTANEAVVYCKKGEQPKEEWLALGPNGPNYGKNAKFTEQGEVSQQGSRRDLELLQREINDGTLTVQQIRQENPMIYHQYGRTLNQLEDDRMETVFRTERTQGFWLWGGTGAGKSHVAFKGFTTETHYVWKLNDNNWQDGYKQQETVIIDDFRGSINYDEMLRMLDEHPNYTVPRRGRPPIPFTSKRVIITSSMPPEDVYNKRNERDSIEQLKRRVHIYELPFQLKSVSEALGVILNPRAESGDSEAVPLHRLPCLV